MIETSAAASGTALASPPASSPFPLQGRSLSWQIGAVIVGTLFLALSSYIKVPMLPVPMTMQTFAVTLVGALMGWRLGGLTIVAWLAEGALGLPVLSGGASGLQHFVGPTGGYLLAFPIAGMLVGWLAQRGWNGRHVGLAFAAMLLGNATCLVLGAAWLSTLVGFDKALMVGVVPFLAGAVVKSALGAATLRALARR
jgi:biotin transport system substrate-specific component